MSDINTMILVEHPLNEKMRTWLRIEYLLKQLLYQKNFKNIASALTFFRAASDLIDILERFEIRGDLLKKLEHQQQKLSNWLCAPNTDKDLIDSLITKLEDCTNALISAPRIRDHLKADRLIISVRQRLSIAGGCCSFDLPALHLWLHLPDEDQTQYIDHIIHTLKPLHHALMMILDFVRQSSSLEMVNSSNGFFKGNTEKGELLRLRIPLKHRVYPKISGHKNRYVIHFIPLEPEQSRSVDNFLFELACC